KATSRKDQVIRELAREPPQLSQSSSGPRREPEYDCELRAGRHAGANSAKELLEPIGGVRKVNDHTKRLAGVDVLKAARRAFVGGDRVYRRLRLDAHEVRGCQRQRDVPSVVGTRD